MTYEKLIEWIKCNKDSAYRTAQTGAWQYAETGEDKHRLSCWINRGKMDAFDDILQFLREQERYSKMAAARLPKEGANDI